MVVAVDAIFAELVMDGPAPPPAAVLRPDVVTLGSMNKLFWTGLRVGWVRADPASPASASLDLSRPVLDQLVAVHLLDDATAILAERREQLRRSRAVLEHALRTRLPDWRWSSPKAGMALWIELPRPSATRLATPALELGLRISPGRASPSTVRPTGGSGCRSRWPQMTSISSSTCSNRPGSVPRRFR
ncbi:aminotransferase class I/II-fold pyridoxal phosphate-dependent enzyme [Pseudonocardia sp. UM4_GMWB1]|uniref:aminotransferase class I/II-fold pyridoxal phosphate-dependent enzyme n=1 Tax=Pseudonocardia sp. UM4_GMWB1 TaxID=2212989 RepID=UPI00307D3FB2